jgi:hypothetical protein
MDLTPGEKAVLGQIRMLYAASARTDQQMKALTMQWAPTHHETYRKAYGALVARALIHDTGGQAFTITAAGLQAIGVAVPKPPQPIRAAAPRPVPPPPMKVQAPRGGFFRRLLGGRA